MATSLSLAAVPQGIRRQVGYSATTISCTNSAGTTEKIDVSRLSSVAVRVVTGSITSVSVYGGKPGGTHKLVDGVGTAGVLTVGDKWVDLGTAAFNMAELSFVRGDGSDGTLEICGKT